MIYTYKKVEDSIYPAEYEVYWVGIYVGRVWKRRRARNVKPEGSRIITGTTHAWKWFYQAAGDRYTSKIEFDRRKSAATACRVTWEQGYKGLA